MPLNEALYERLKASFGSVLISNEGMGSSFKFIQDAINKDWMKPKISRWGECYRVNCFACGDTRHRLYVHHRCGTREVIPGRNEPYYFGWSLVHCFNEECEKRDYGGMSFREAFKDLMQPYISRVQLGDVEIKEAEVHELTEVTLPGFSVNLSDLDDNHRAVQYLLGRGFNPRKLGKEKNWSYCVSVDHEHPRLRPAIDRIIIPVYRDGVLVGWQGRYIGDPPNDRVPKYFTLPGFSKSLTFYNFDAASQFDDVAVVEGPLDVERVGPFAVGLMGKSIGEMQLQLLYAHWGEGLVYLMLDPDASIEMIDLSKMLLRGKKFKGIVPVKIPDGRDPGNMSQEMNFSLMREAIDRSAYGALANLTSR